MSEFYFLMADIDRLNPDLGGSEVNQVDRSPIHATLTTPDGPVEIAEDLFFWLGTEEPFHVPEPVEFTGFFPTVLETDMPIAEKRLPLISRALLTTLLEVGDFPHRVITTRITDDVEASGGDPDYPVGRTTDAYILLQVLGHLDILDLERSEYGRHNERTGSVTGLEKAVLHLPKSGLPPLFCLKPARRHLLVSAAGRAALEAAGIRGVRFSDNPYY
ncbi:hypothetical protein [Deinococcus sp.]|uniref:hypothetical protein n=1 Tax=Deinococcus sp. TaxID=47478 RepID=UPI0025BF99FC|nr:hypothetical protein [Deinococcus sp.]